MSAPPATAPSSAVRRRTALAPELVVVWLSGGDDGEGEDGVLAELRGTPGIALEVLPGPDARPEKADVVHVSRSALGGLRECRRAFPGATLVLDLRGASAAALGRREARRASAFDLVIARSASDREALERRSRTLTGRAVVVPRQLDLDAHAPEPVLAERRRTQLKRFRNFHRLAPPTVLFCGPYTRAGGLDLALDAAFALREEHPELRLAAIPEGEVDRRYLDLCERRALALGHHGVVEWSVEPDELPFWFAAATAVCLPCRHPLASGAPRLAAAAARPFVGSDVPALAETVAQGQTGLLVPAGDLGALTAALRRLVEDPEQAARVGAAARARVEAECSAATIAARLAAVWRRARPAAPVGRPAAEPA